MERLLINLLVVTLLMQIYLVDVEGLAGNVSTNIGNANGKRKASVSTVFVFNDQN